eukprot:scaffold1418_cov92-Skeletonema_dohrnii-CCMP3373.AAC.4
MISGKKLAATAVCCCPPPFERRRVSSKKGADDFRLRNNCGSHKLDKSERRTRVINNVTDAGVISSAT